MWLFKSKPTQEEEWLKISGVPKKCKFFHSWEYKNWAERKCKKCLCTQIYRTHWPLDVGYWKDKII